MQHEKVTDFVFETSCSYLIQFPKKYKNKLVKILLECKTKNEKILLKGFLLSVMYTEYFNSGIAPGWWNTSTIDSFLRLIEFPEFAIEESRETIIE